MPGEELENLIYAVGNQKCTLIIYNTVSVCLGLIKYLGLENPKILNYRCDTADFWWPMNFLYFWTEVKRSRFFSAIESHGHVISKKY